MKNALTPLAKRVLIPIGLSAGMSALDAAIQNKIYGWSHLLDLVLHTTPLIISN